MEYSQEALEEMAEQVDLLEYASNTVDFVRHSGNTHFAICPFHHEYTASLAVNDAEKFFYCFGCHTSGNIYKWIQLTEGLTFEQSVEKVARLTETNLQDVRISGSLKYFKELKRLQDKDIDTKVERQILPDDYMERFAHEVPQEWVDEGISAQVMSEYGVCIDNNSNRICYPVYDNDDNLIGVKGRTRFKNFKDLMIPKYNNYTKIQTIDFFSGMKQNRNSIIKAGSVYIFEGIKSGMKYSTWGLGNNWLAAETSRLNKTQIKILLELHIREVNVAFDRDVDLKQIKDNLSLLKKFCNVYIVRDRYNKNRLLPGDKDSPVDAGREVWEQLVKEKTKYG